MRSSLLSESLWGSGEHQPVSVAGGQGCGEGPCVVSSLVSSSRPAIPPFCLERGGSRGGTWGWQRGGLPLTFLSTSPQSLAVCLCCSLLRHCHHGESLPQPWDLAPSPSLGPPAAFPCRAFGLSGRLPDLFGCSSPPVPCPGASEIPWSTVPTLCPWNLRSLLPWTGWGQSGS